STGRVAFHATCTARGSLVAGRGSDSGGCGVGVGSTDVVGLAVADSVGDGWPALGEELGVGEPKKRSRLQAPRVMASTSSTERRAVRRICPGEWVMEAASYGRRWPPAHRNLSVGPPRRIPTGAAKRS